MAATGPESVFPRERDVQYARIYTGVSWPAARQGFVAVVGEHRYEKVLARPVLHVLDEAAETNLRLLVERLAGLRFYYRPERIYGDAEHVAAMQFVAERAQLFVEGALLLALHRPLAYALPALERLLHQRRLLVPEGSALRGELLTVPRDADPGTLALAEYPGLAALAFAVLALEQTFPEGHSRQRRAVTDYHLTRERAWRRPTRR